jgi:hypothetical protein
LQQQISNHASVSANAISEQGLSGGPAGAAWNLPGGLTPPVFHDGTLVASRRAAADSYQATFAT